MQSLSCRHTSERRQAILCSLRSWPVRSLGGVGVLHRCRDWTLCQLNGRRPSEPVRCRSLPGPEWASQLQTVRPGHVHKRDRPGCLHRLSFRSFCERDRDAIVPSLPGRIVVILQGHQLLAMRRRKLRFISLAVSMSAVSTGTIRQRTRCNAVLAV